VVGEERPGDVAHVPADLEDMIPGYLSRLKDDLGSARAALGSGDLAAVQTFGHKSAGSGGSYGFPEVTRLGRAIEAAAKANDRAALPGLFDELAGHLERVRIVYDEDA
jgi:HPt (histidine-containing phosphotransfer) domain-containing protein